jgi:hypothetical protein
LIFDSLQTGSRARVAATLRDYLKCEFKARLTEDRDFNKDNMKGCCPKVPQQPNFSDCGLFALQYVESFFKSPLKDFNLPIKNLGKWFPSEVMRQKRSEIATIIRNLALQQNKDKKFDFPDLVFTPDSGSGYTDDEDGDDSGSLNTTSKLLKPKFFVKSVSTTITASNSTTRVICLSSSGTKTLALTPSKVLPTNSSNATPVSGASSNQSLMIQRKKGKIEYFTLQTNNKLKKQPNNMTKTVNVVIPRLTIPGNSMVRKDVQVGASSVTSSSVTSSVTSVTSSEMAEGSKEPILNNDDNEASSKQSPDSTSKMNLVSYSDSSPEDLNQDDKKLEAEEISPPALDMDVDEDGAPMPSCSTSGSAGKRPLNSQDENSVENSAENSGSKKAKIDGDVEEEKSDA